MQYNLTSEDYLMACNAVDSILKQPVENIEMNDSIPTIDDCSDSNKVFKGKLSILFVDIRKSTDLTDELKSKKMVKIYRAFLRLSIQAIRYCGGFTRQFAGDGVMGAFQDDAGENGNNSSEKAVKAARYISTLIDYCLNPKLKKQLGGITIGCGLGICTGTIMVTKTGMRGKEKDETSENEMGIVWVGKTTNYASRFCSLSNAGEIFIDETTFDGIETNDFWVKTKRTKGAKLFEGFCASRYYLDLPQDIDIEPVIDEKPALSLTETVSEIKTKIETLKLYSDSVLTDSIDSLRSIAETQEKVFNETKEKLESVTKEKSKITQQYEKSVESVKELASGQYHLISNLFSKAFCNDKFIDNFEKSYWYNLVNLAISLGAIIGKTETQVKSDLDCYLVDLYSHYEDHENAYDALCIQAEYGSWIHAHTIEEVVGNCSRFSRLQDILKQRSTPYVEDDYSKGLEQLEKMGY